VIYLDPLHSGGYIRFLCLPTSVGFFICIVAKKFPLFDSVADFTTMLEARTAWLLQRIDVGEVWGVGRRIGAKLRAMGIATVQDLNDAPPGATRTHFGVVLERTCNELRGLSCLDLEEVTAPRKEIVS